MAPSGLAGDRSTLEGGASYIPQLVFIVVQQRNKCRAQVHNAEAWRERWRAWLEPGGNRSHFPTVLVHTPRKGGKGSGGDSCML